MQAFTVQVIVPWRLTWIVAPVVIVLHVAGVVTTERTARMVTWGVRVKAI